MEENNPFNGPRTGGKMRDGSHRTAILSTSVAETGGFSFRRPWTSGMGWQVTPATHLPLPHPGNRDRKRCCPGATACRNPRAKVDARTLSRHDQA